MPHSETLTKNAWVRSMFAETEKKIEQQFKNFLKAKYDEKKQQKSGSTKLAKVCKFDKLFLNKAIHTTTQFDL